MDRSLLRDNFLSHLSQGALKGISTQAASGNVDRKLLITIGQELLRSDKDVVVISGSYHHENSSYLSDADIYCIQRSEPESEMRRQLRIIHGVPCEINLVGTGFLDKFLPVTGSMRSGRTTPALADCGYLTGDVQLYTSTSDKARSIMDTRAYQKEIAQLRETYRYSLTSLLMDLVSERGYAPERMVVWQIAATLCGLFSLHCLGWNHSPQYLGKLSLVKDDVCKLLGELDVAIDLYQSTGSWLDVYELAFRWLQALGGARWADYGDATRIL